MQHIKPYRGILIFAISLLFVQGICDLALPGFMSQLVNEGVVKQNQSAIFSTGAIMLLVTLISSLASITMGYNASKLSANVSSDLRRDVFNKVEHFSNSEFDKFSTASLITRTTNDITQIQTMLVMMIRFMFYAPIMAIGGIIMAISKSPSMTWIIGIAVIALIGMIAILMVKTLPKFTTIQNLLDRLNLVSRENIEGTLVIRAFNTQKFEGKRFDVANEDLTKTNLFINRTMSLMMPVMMIIMNLTAVAIIGIGGEHVFSGNMMLGDIMAYMQYAMQVIMSFLFLSMMFVMVPRALVSANRIQEVLLTEESVLDPILPSHFPGNFAPEVRFRNVSFKYPEADDAMLSDIDFTCEAGKFTAIIGATGSGKSSLVKLVMRFYDVTEGAISVSGTDIREVTKAELRSKIGYVSQKNVLFSGTIGENIAYSDANMSENEIKTAAKIAQADDFIGRMEEKFDAPISQGGTNVSGGQRQRLAIARALAKNSEIYVFDDSFSALDFKTDKELRAAIAECLKDKTMLVIAQRIGTIMFADKIIVLEHGKIVGTGTHEKLLKTCDVYREIAESQFGEEAVNNG